ncbi:MAG TPA: DUF6325 family protein [Candidatus Limnocylindrales bacterium]|nr:DUF6325 family protein [Candidatus Limnocylindrales bacterium]
MAVGPVEYIVIAFPGNQFKGEVAPALRQLVEEGTIDVIDLAFIHKDVAGDVTIMELEQEDSAIFAAFESLAAKRGGLISDEDMLTIAAALDPNSSAAVIVWEDRWAERFVGAVRRAGGVVVDLQRVPADAVEAAIAFQASATQS